MPVVHIHMYKGRTKEQKKGTGTPDHRRFRAGSQCKTRVAPHPFSGYRQGRLGHPGKSGFRSLVGQGALTRPVSFSCSRYPDSSSSRLRLNRDQMAAGWSGRAPVCAKSRLGEAMLGSRRDHSSALLECAKAAGPKRACPTRVPCAAGS